eukprot:scaffold10856_cov229-Amphora_coffeaeformis.AAC.30
MNDFFDEGEYKFSTSPEIYSKEDNDTENDEVRRLAARLAPTFEKAEELLALPAEFGRNDSSNIERLPFEDDDMDQELQDLANSEDMLRRELEDIQAFSNLIKFPASGSTARTTDEVTSSQESPFDYTSGKFEWNSPPRQHPQSSPPPRNPVASVVEADVDGGEQDAAPEQKYLPRTARTPSSPSPMKSPNGKSNRKSMTPPLLRMGNQPIPYHAEDHQKVLHVERNLEFGWYTVDLTSHLVKSSTKHKPGHGLEEICIALPQKKLQSCFIGMQGSKPNQAAAAPLPVRTLMLRIRPDVLCGAVMDAVTTSLHNAKVWKRQGGHLRALIRSQYDEENARMFVVDAQVVTLKSIQCRRYLLMRVYHADATFTDHDPDEEFDMAPLPVSSDNPMSERAISPAATLHLREACALLERMEYPSTPNKALHRPAQSPSMSDRETMSQSVRQHLLDHYQACPSVKLGKPTLPSLNPDDWPVVQASWPWIYDVWSELENRELTYTTLSTTTSFGKFPSLSTLDVHFCSQIRRFSRETMVMQLLKSASELEEYARQSEYACANMISLLRATFEAYEVDPPALPEPVPLTSYPLDFVPPQTECPPWGRRVMEALNHVQAASSSTIKGGNEMDHLFTGEMPSNQLDVASAADSLKRAEEAVAMVFTAFQQQDDEEKGARLARKNVQVMDRLSKMEEHQRNSILILSKSNSPKAELAANEVFAKTKIREIPLIKWTVMVGSSTGTCWVTAKHIIFSTQLIPILGSTTRHVFDWGKILVSKSETTPSLLNPLSCLIHIQSVDSGETLYSFRPSVGGARLHSFLTIVQTTARSLSRET